MLSNPPPSRRRALLHSGSACHLLKPDAVGRGEGLESAEQARRLRHTDAGEGGHLPLEDGVGGESRGGEGDESAKPVFLPLYYVFVGIERRGGERGRVSANTGCFPLFDVLVVSMRGE